jgi:hypothetical protein
VLEADDRQQYSEAQFVRLALQADVDAAGLKYRVQLKAA